MLIGTCAPELMNRSLVCHLLYMTFTILYFFKVHTLASRLPYKRTGTIINFSIVVWIKNNFLMH